jgi:hypothetical protein
MFIAKYSPQGKLIWVKQAGGEGDDVNYAIALDAVAKVTVVGTFRGNASFGNFVLRDSNRSAAFFAAQLSAARN